MTAKDVLTGALKMTLGLVESSLADLSDADLQVSPVTGANNIAWQIGHLIASEKALGTNMGISYPVLPPAVEALAPGSSAKSHGQGGNLPKDEYLSLFKRVRATTLGGLEKLGDADLDKPNDGPMKGFAPTYGALFNLVGIHTMMHCGQFSVVRRALGKPVLM